VVEDERTESQAPTRKQFLVHIDSDVIRRVKILAIDRGVSASSLVQEAIIEFLSRGQKPGTKT
jgi:predicted HicB family RNase H-like nuclease